MKQSRERVMHHNAFKMRKLVKTTSRKGTRQMVVSIEYAHNQEFITPEVILRSRLQMRYFCIMCNCGSFHWLCSPHIPALIWSIKIQFNVNKWCWNSDAISICRKTQTKRDIFIWTLLSQSIASFKQIVSLPQSKQLLHLYFQLYLQPYEGPIHISKPITFSFSQQENLLSFPKIISNKFILLTPRPASIQTTEKRKTKTKNR